MKSVYIRISMVTSMSVLLGLFNLSAGHAKGSTPTDRKNSMVRQTGIQRSAISSGTHRQLSDPNSIRKTEASLNYGRYVVHSNEELLSSRIPNNHAQIPHGVLDHVTTGTPQIFVVTSTADTGEGSFRKAIHDANANPGPDSIVFNISGGGIQTIKPTTFYEVITSPVVIDGTTQPGYVDHPVIEIDGENQHSQYPCGLEIDAQNVTIRGLAINRFVEGIIVDTSGGDIIEGNYIGTDPTGEISLPNINFGITLSGPHNHIGGTTLQARNVIQGSWQNIEILGNDPSWLAYSHDNVIQGNIIGLDAAGKQIINTAPQQAGGGAISLFGSYNDSIGGIVPGAGNIISGNLDGIYFGGYDHLQNTVPSYGSVIQGNFIGLDVTGTVPLGNLQAGLTFYRSYGNFIGGASAAARNIFANNAQNGIRLLTAITANNTIQGNYIGTDSGGTVLPSNTSGNGEGIYSIYAHDNIIGGTAQGAGNLINGNLDNGIFLDTMSMNFQIEGNWIGVMPGKQAGLPAGNQFHGLVISSSPRNIIGGTDQGAGNTIGANSYHGILVTGDSAEGNTIAGNFIGTDALDALGLGNAVNGILIDGTKNIIGGSAPGATNTIDENGGVGVYILSGTGNTISQNSIYENGMLGIDIFPTGPNINDSLDADVGPNNMQNFPVIDSVIHTIPLPPHTLVKGHFNSVPNNDYHIEFFENYTGDTSHYGEGNTFIGSTDVTTDASGNATFSFVGPSTPDFAVITATATDTAGNTSEFSKDIKPITIINPVSGELWITQQPDTIAWRVTGGFDSVMIGYSTDGGSTFYVVSRAGAKQGSYIWFPPKGTLSKKSLIAVWDLYDFTVADTSGMFKIKGYELTRDSSGQYVRYDVRRDGWIFPNDSASLWPVTWFSQINYQTGTDPATGLKYAARLVLDGKSSDFPSWSLFEQAFGVDQCFFSTTFGIYRPSVLNLWFARRGEWGGSCFGLANTSFMSFDDHATFSGQYSQLGTFNNLYDLNLSSDARNVCNTIMTRQWGKFPHAIVLAGQNVTPQTTLEDLKHMFVTETRNDPVLVIYNQNGSGAHAVCPYKLENDPADPTLKSLYIYDNNVPGSQSQIITIDSLSNQWSYPGLPGWGGNKGITLIDPNADYYNPPGIENMPANRQAGSVSTSSGILDIYNTSTSSMKITNAAGDSIGYANGKIFNSTSNGIPDIPITGYPHPPTGYELPSVGNYTVTMQTTVDTAEFLSAFTDSTHFMFHRSHTHPNEVDQWQVGTTFTYTNKDTAIKQAQMGITILHGSDERVVNLANVKVRGGDSLHLDPTDRLNLKLSPVSDSLRCDLQLEYAAGTGDILFTHTGITLPPHAAFRIQPAWDSMAYSPAKILIDHANSGVFDDSVSINNQSIGWYPDSVHITPVFITGGKSAVGNIVLNAIAPHGGIVIHLSSTNPLYASVPPTVFIPVGQQVGSFPVTTQITAVPESVVIAAIANGITVRDTFPVLPQGIESLTLNPTGGVIGGDSATCTVTVSNPAPSGGTLITLTNGNPAIATLPSSVTVPQTAITKSFTVYTSHVQHTDSCIITASSGLRQASVRLLIGSFGNLRIVPDTVVGGNGVTLYDSIAVPAPPTGIQYTLKSSDTVTAWTLPYLYLGSGQTQTYANIQTSGVGKDTMVTFSVTNAPYPLNTQLLVRPCGMSSVSSFSQFGCFVGKHGPIDLQTVIAGNPILLQVSLDGEAPPAGALIKLKSDQPSVLPVDSVIAVPYNNSNATVTVTSSDAVSSPQRVIITFSYRGKELQDTVTIFPRLHYRLIEFGDSTFDYAAWAVNNSGLVFASGSQGWSFWKNGQTTPMSSFHGFNIYVEPAPGVMNDSGHIVGSVNNHAAFWKPDTTIVLTEPPGYTQSTGYAINNHDDVVGTTDTSGFGLDQKAFLWSGGAVTLLDDYGPVYHSFPYAINNARQVIGNAIRNYYGYTFGSAGLLWENGHITWSLPGSTIGPYNTPIIPSATVINDSGIIAGEYYIQPAYSGQGWFIRRGTDTTNLPTLPPYYGMNPLGINRLGVIVGDMWGDDEESRPVGFLYKDGYYYDLNCLIDSLPPSRQLTMANAINDQGVIAGAVRLLHYNSTRPCILVPSGISTGVSSSRNKQLPVEYKLYQNYPNPFNPATTIHYELPKVSKVTVTIYNLLGQKVATLVDGVESPGYRSTIWNAQNYASGVYFYRLEAASMTVPVQTFIQVRKMLLMK